MVEHAERRLAAIVSADVAGYSRLMGQDEPGTLAALKAHRAELVDSSIAGHGGRIVKTAGDGMLLEFPSVVAAVACCIEVQEGMTKRNADVADEDAIRLRIGIHLGDVIVDGDDIFGDGVNIAARLQELGEPGGIAVSAIVHEYLDGQTALGFVDHGERQLKNIRRPIRVWQWSSEGIVEATAKPAARSDKPVIAVLPFTNMSVDADQEYFADGITEDIITDLSRFHQISVIARNSAFTYKGRAVSITQVHHELGAQYVLEGSVRKAGDRVRVTAQLVDAADDSHIWAERYDRRLEDIFDLQDELSRRISAILVPELSRAEIKRASKKHPNNLQAWDYYLRGMAHLNEFSAEGNTKARDEFTHAISLDPEYCQAYSELATSYVRDINLGFAKDRDDALDKAQQAAQRAIQLDERSAPAHRALSTVYLLRGESDIALAEARLAVECNPNDAGALNALGNKSDLSGISQGLEMMVTASQLSPQDPDRHQHLSFMARAYVNRRDYAQALECAKSAIQRRPDFPNAHFVLAIALGHLGRLDEAAASLERCRELDPTLIDKRKDWRPYVDPESNRHLQLGLSKALNAT
jgi:adenylate cyclase